MDKGFVFDIQRWSIHDGYGIRTNVFLKGCPLRCRWCSNPESQKKYPELAFFPDKCIHCGSCQAHCPVGAIRLGEGGQERDLALCRATCFEGQGGFPCLRECYAEALKQMGKWMDADTVLEEVLSDKGIYETSGGGVTFTGGEPFVQHEFLLTLLKKSKEQGLHTTVESCVCVPWEHMETALDDVDFLFADLKIFDSEKHRLYTGVGNERILSNLIHVNEYAKTHPLTIAIRMPVIPGVNASAQEVEAAAAWIEQNLDQVKIFELLPYHRLGRGKYENIGETYPMEDVAPPTDEEMEALRQICRRHGLRPSYQ